MAKRPRSGNGRFAERASRSSRLPRPSKPTRRISNSPARRPNSRSSGCGISSKRGSRSRTARPFAMEPTGYGTLGQPLGREVSPLRTEGEGGGGRSVELDEALRSLGLRPHAAEIAGHRHDDTLRGVKESRRTQPPAEYRDQVRQYMQGVSCVQNGATTGRGPQAPRQPAPAGTEKVSP